jgi:methyl-accepting chemotaxis protein
MEAGEDAPHRTGLRELRRGTFPQLLAGLLAAVLPITIVLTVLLTQRAGDALTDSLEDGLSVAAGNLAARVDVWTENRRRDLELVALGLTGSPLEAARRLRELDRVRGAYDAIQLLGLDGRRIAASRPGPVFPTAGEPWFSAATGGTAMQDDIRREGAALRWYLAVPVRRGGRVTAVLAADVGTAQLQAFLRDARLGRTGESLLVDAEQRVILADRGDGAPLRVRYGSESAANVVAGRMGSARHEAVDGRDVITGYAPVKRTGWGALVHQDEDEAFAAVTDQREVALVVVLVALLLTTLFAFLLARRTIRPLTAVAAAARRVATGDLSTRVTPSGAAEVEELGGAFNRMVASLESLNGQIAEAGAQLSSSAAELGSAAEELSATTARQSSAATETSATMEELARTSRSIASTVANVATQTTDTRDVLRQAGDELQRSSERILGLAGRVGEVSVLLELINDIADQTNLLALNAAIEAARAGEAGRGFGVVADEVRRLAERSKASAADIEEIITSTQAETNATVMAMEASSKQMERGLGLMDTVMSATDQVRLTTQQQGAATQQVVDTMESVTEASRQTSVTAQQISASATALTDLVADMQRAAEAAGNHR